MRGMNSTTFDLIYLDPPFNSKANYAAPIGSVAAGAAFKDTWTLNDIDIEWLDLIESKHPALHRVIMAAMRDSDKSYLIYMSMRLLEMKRLLKSTGTIYLHCDPTMSHYLKLVMDAILDGLIFLQTSLISDTQSTPSPNLGWTPFRSKFFSTQETQRSIQDIRSPPRWRRNCLTSVFPIVKVKRNAGISTLR